MSSSSQLSQHFVGTTGIEAEENGRSEFRLDEVTEAQFDQQATKIVRIIETTVKFLVNAGCDVQNLLVSHLEKITTILDIMQRRNHSRSETVVATLKVLLEVAKSWTLGNSVLDFLQERDMDYFLKHANALRMTSEMYRQRLPDFLLLLMLDHQYVSPRHVRNVLKYGLSSEQSADLDCVAVQARLGFAKLLKAKQDEGDDLSDVHQIGRLLVAALPPVSCHAVRLADVSKMLHGFPELFGGTVPSLRHLCRTLIRSSLHANWTLPDGIHLLDLPVQVKAYLDLET